MKETKFRNTEIGMIPEEWKMYSIGKDCSVKARIGWQGLTTSEYLQTGDYGLITSTDLIEGSPMDHRQPGGCLQRCSL